MLLSPKMTLSTFWQVIIFDLLLSGRTYSIQKNYLSAAKFTVKTFSDSADHIESPFITDEHLANVANVYVHRCTG